MEVKINLKKDEKLSEKIIKKVVKRAGFKYVSTKQ